MKQSKKKAGKAKKPKYELTYFLDHPQIQRHECVGNQEPAQVKQASQSPFAHVGAAAGATPEKAAQAGEAQKKMDSQRSPSGMLGNLKKNLGF
jgi:hypothetical protein